VKIYRKQPRTAQAQPPVEELYPTPQPDTEPLYGTKLIDLRIDKNLTDLIGSIQNKYQMLFIDQGSWMRGVISLNTDHAYQTAISDVRQAIKQFAGKVNETETQINVFIAQDAETMQKVFSDVQSLNAPVRDYTPKPPKPVPVQFKPIMARIRMSKSLAKNNPNDSTTINLVDYFSKKYGIQFKNTYSGTINKVISGFDGAFFIKNEQELKEFKQDIKFCKMKWTTQVVEEDNTISVFMAQSRGGFYKAYKRPYTEDEQEEDILPTLDELTDDYNPEETTVVQENAEDAMKTIEFYLPKGMRNPDAKKSLPTPGVPRINEPTFMSEAIGKKYNVEFETGGYGFKTHKKGTLTGLTKEEYEQIIRDMVELDKEKSVHMINMDSGSIGVFITETEKGFSRAFPEFAKQ